VASLPAPFFRRYASFSAVMKESAGTLLYRRQSDRLDVLLVHPSGNYNRRAPWGIPKGIPDVGETLEAAARRETQEETGITPGNLISLGSIVYRKSRKQVHCFAGAANADDQPRCASWEVDRAEFLPFDDARRQIHPDQLLFLDRLVAWLESGQAPPTAG
jgi:predicted NUDIX family NTP pyrophosphohydrolase